MLTVGLLGQIPQMPVNPARQASPVPSFKSWHKSRLIPGEEDFFRRDMGRCRQMRSNYPWHLLSIQTCPL